jgi:hypothetical protein
VFVLTWSNGFKNILLVAENRKSSVMSSLYGPLFTRKELQELLEGSVTCVCVEKRVRHVGLLPHSLGYLKSAIHGTLNSYQNKFDVR